MIRANQPHRKRQRRERALNRLRHQIAVVEPVTSGEFIRLDEAIRTLNQKLEATREPASV